MSDVLSQSEVEALLAALDQSETSEKRVSSKPVVGPVPATADLIADQLPGEITLYDFKRPERVGKEHMRALQSIHEGFSRNLGAALSGFLRTIVDVKLVSVDQLTYSEFIFSLENPTCFNVLTCEPLEGHMVLEINPSIVYPIIDRLLGGGRSDVLIPRRPLTEIETRLVSRIAALAVDGLKAVWSNIIPLRFRTDRIESNPQLVYIVPPNEVIVLISFEIAIGDLRGMMNLCIPFNVIEPVIDKLSTNIWLSYARKESPKRDKVLGNLANAPVEIVAYLGETSITADDLVNLKVGDILPIEKRAGAPMLVTVGGQPKFWGMPKTMNQRVVVQVASRADKKARING
jgi:flagellar motor switch protein FliM